MMSSVDVAWVKTEFHWLGFVINHQAGAEDEIGAAEQTERLTYDIPVVGLAMRNALCGFVVLMDACRGRWASDPAQNLGEGEEIQR
jgi:hypothetical protein